MGRPRPLVYSDGSVWVRHGETMSPPILAGQNGWSVERPRSTLACQCGGFGWVLPPAGWLIKPTLADGAASAGDGLTCTCTPPVHPVDTPSRSGRSGRAGVFHPPRTPTHTPTHIPTQSSHSDSPDPIFYRPAQFPPTCKDDTQKQQPKT